MLVCWWTVQLLPFHITLCISWITTNWCFVSDILVSIWTHLITFIFGTVVNGWSLTLFHSAIHIKSSLANSMIAWVHCQLLRFYLWVCFTSAALFTWWIEPAASCWCYDAVLTVWHGCLFLPSELGSASSCLIRSTGWWPRNLGLNCGRTETVLSYPWHQDQLWGLLVTYLVGTGGALPVWEVDIFLSSNSIRMHASIPLFSRCA